MSRIRKAVEDHHAIVLGSDIGDEGEMMLVKGGRMAYLWVGPERGRDGIYTFSGAVALRKLAKAILEEVGA